MYISLEELIIILCLVERSDNEIVLPIKLEPSSQNWDAGLKKEMRGRDNNNNNKNIKITKTSSTAVTQH